jgi:uncharacterized repeat protein (TIGR03803 family)
MPNPEILRCPFRRLSLRGRKVWTWGQLELWKTCILLLFCLAVAVASSATTFTTLASFHGTNGDRPYFVALVQGTDGNLYGTTSGGGVNGEGTVFSITPAGTLTTLYSFCSQTNCSDGYFPYAGLVQASNGSFYGTTGLGGANDEGTVFEITPAGALTTLYSFCSQTNCTDGELPEAGLVQAANGDFYGTTVSGGTFNEGTVFRITPSGTLTTLYSFCSQPGCTDGYFPYAGLVQASNGNFYGTTGNGGANGFGTLFEITPTGTLTTLHSFCSETDCSDGETPHAALIQAANGNFYGTTQYGGASSGGTVFEITAAGKLTTLYSFCSETNCTDGETPEAGLVQASNGKFYGTTEDGGASSGGTLYEITPAGSLTTLYSFCFQTDCTDGDLPFGGLAQATNGTFYGTTYAGGANSEGAVFSLTVGLGPFVQMLQVAGKVGASVIILGTDLTGATGVSFSGTAAKFTVVSATEITTTVPAGATTGTVSVTTPGGTLDSNVKFRVLPQIKSFQPPSGPVGTVVTITGVSLTQTTAVTFGGVKASSFTVNSDTQVTVTVPAGAKTGKIGITTPGGMATSATSFTVT